MTSLRVTRAEENFIRRTAMLKSVSICAALILAAVAFAESAEARQGFGGRMGGMSGFKGMSGAGPGRMGMARPMGMGPGRVAWSGKGNWSTGNWSGNRWAGNWRGGHWRGGRWWPWWGVGAGLALAATWPYYGGYGYGYDSCVQWVPDYGWVNVCGYPYGSYYY